MGMKPVSARTGRLFVMYAVKKSHGIKCKLKNKIAYDNWFVNQMKKAQHQQHHQDSNGKTDKEQIKDNVQESIKKGWCTFQNQEYCGM